MSDEASTDNGLKLDRILNLLEGSKDVPGALARLSAVEHALTPNDGSSGIVTKVAVMWRLHVWLLCSLSGLAGWMLKSLIQSPVIQKLVAISN